MCCISFKISVSLEKLVSKHALNDILFKLTLINNFLMAVSLEIATKICLP